MLEALAAVGLAGNVATFLECSLRVISNSHRARDTVSRRELQDTAARLDSLCVQFNQDRKSLPNTLTQNELALKGVSYKCQTAARQLIDALNKINPNIDSRWSSFRAALQSIWKEKEISEMEKHLKHLSNLLNLHFSASLSNGQSSLHSSLETLCHQHRRHQVRSTNELDSLRETVIGELKKTHFSMESRIKEMSDLSDNIARLLNEGIRIEQHCACLASLRYERMNLRRESVRDAHGDTFRWIYSPQHQGRDVGFNHWLENENGAFWITGKAGSGKSTLMKTILEDNRTRDMLAVWAAGKKLVVANHFFWRVGTDLQKSQEGLLRSLLYEILRNCPEHMQSVASNFFELYQSHERYQWSFAELERAFNAITRTVLSARFCFFIDGVDEYKGEAREIARVLNNIGLSPNVKLCLASRPWNAFEVEFGQNNAGVLQLHEHTAEDIRLYVHEMLETDELYQRLRTTDSRYQYAVQSIVEKAKGVFLWVSLVVKGLFNSLPNADTVEDFQRRIDAFPEELDQYFHEMLKGIQDTYHEQSSEILLMALASNGRLPLASLIPVMERNLDPIRMEIEPMSETQWHDKAQDMIKRLRARCLDLLEIFNPSGEADLGYSLDFLHRTVYDYLNHPPVHELLRQRVDAAFNPSLMIAKSLVALMKVFPEKKPTFVSPHSIINYVEQAVGKNSEAGFEILDEAEKVYRLVWPKKQTASAKKCVLGIPVAITERRCDLILDSAIQMGFDRYVATRIHDCEEHVWDVDGRPPLLSALVFPPTSDESMDKQPKIPEPDMVQTLIDLGANASQNVGENTVWYIFLRRSWELRSQYELQNEEFHSQWVNSVALLLKSGADPNCRLHGMKRFGTPMVGGVIEERPTEKHSPRLHSTPNCAWDLFDAMCTHEETEYLRKQASRQKIYSLLSLVGITIK